MFELKESVDNRRKKSAFARELSLRPFLMSFGLKFSHFGLVLDAHSRCADTKALITLSRVTVVEPGTDSIVMPAS